VRFYYSNGTVLKDSNNLYKATDGQVSVSSNFIPIFETSTFNDFVMFMPYDELHLIKGNHRLKFNVGIFDHNNRQIATSNYVYFYVNQ